MNILKYNSLQDLIGKYLKLIIELKGAKEIPEKLAFEVQSRYQWLDLDNTEFSTKVVTSGADSGVPLSRAPQFGYKSEHIIEIDDELISKMSENTLRFGVYGKVEQKKRLKEVLFSPRTIIVEEEGGSSPKKGQERRESIDPSLRSSKQLQGLSLEEIERLRKEN